MNNVTLIGHLGNNPEAKKLDNGTTLCNFSVATNKRWTKDGEKQERTDWHRIVAFGPLAEVCMEHINKGSHVAIFGELRTNSWQDDAGNNRRSVEVIAKKVDFLDKRSDAPAAPADDAPTFDDDDIPF
jgi:single-strand DNA-binding protein